MERSRGAAAAATWRFSRDPQVPCLSVDALLEAEGVAAEDVFVLSVDAEGYRTARSLDGVAPRPRPRPRPGSSRLSIWTTFDAAAATWIVPVVFLDRAHASRTIRGVAATRPLEQVRR